MVSDNSRKARLININLEISRHLMVKLQKTKEKKKILKEVREKETYYLYRINWQLSFLQNLWKSEEILTIPSKCWHTHRILYLADTSFKDEGKNKSTFGIKLSGFITSRPIFLRNTKEFYRKNYWFQWNHACAWKNKNHWKG